HVARTHRAAVRRDAGGFEPIQARIERGLVGQQRGKFHVQAKLVPSSAAVAADSSVQKPGVRPKRNGYRRPRRSLPPAAAEGGRVGGGTPVTAGSWRE